MKSTTSCESLSPSLDRNGLENDHRDAKFTVLSESVRHHIKEEEGEMLPKAKSVEMDFEALSQSMLGRKKQLKRDGIPPDAEHAMVAAVNGNGDAPAAAARRTKSSRRAIHGLQARTSRLAKSSSSSKRSRTEDRKAGARPGSEKAVLRRRVRTISSTRIGPGSLSYGATQN
jgi:hypothetical protein